MDDSDISTPCSSHPPSSHQHWPPTPPFTPTQSTGASRQPSQPPSQQPSPSPSASSAGSPFPSSAIPQINIIPPTPPEQHKPLPSSAYSGERRGGPHDSSPTASKVNVASPSSVPWQRGSSDPERSHESAVSSCRPFEPEKSDSNRSNPPSRPRRWGSLGSNPLTSATIDGSQPHATIHIPYYSSTTSAMSVGTSPLGQDVDTAPPQELPPSIARPASAPPSLPLSPTDLLRAWETMRLGNPFNWQTMCTSLSASSKFDHPPKTAAWQDGYQTDARHSASNSTSSTIAGSLSSPYSGMDHRTQRSSQIPSHPACLVPGNCHMRTDCGAGQTEKCLPQPEDGIPGGDEGAKMFHSCFWESESRRSFGSGLKRDGQIPELRGDFGIPEMDPNGLPAELEGSDR